MKSAISGAQTAVKNANDFSTEHTALTAKFDEIKTIGHNLQSNVDGRLLWLELLKAVDAALPKDTRPAEEKKETEEDVAQRPELHIESMDCEYYTDLAPWYTSIQKFYISSKPEAAPPADAAADATEAEAETGEAMPLEEQPPAEEIATPEPPLDQSMDATGMDGMTGDPTAAAPATGQSGPGWVIQLRGYHLHNSLPDKKVDVGDEARQFIINTFFKNLESGTVKLPDGENGELVDVPIADLGIRYPVVVTQERTKSVQYLADSSDLAPGVMPVAPAMERGRRLAGNVPGEEQPTIWKLRQYDFIIQFSWQPQPRGQRIEKMAKRGEATPSTAAAAGEAVLTGDSS